MAEKFNHQLELEDFPELSDDPQDALTEGLPALRPLLRSLYEELVLSNPRAGMWTNEISRDEFYGIQVAKASDLIKNILRSTDTRLVLETSAQEDQPPIHYSKLVRDPSGSYEEVSELEPGKVYPVYDAEGEYVRIPDGWIHYFKLGQLLYQNGDLIFLNLETKQ